MGSTIRLQKKQKSIRTFESQSEITVNLSNIWSVQKDDKSVYSDFVLLEMGGMKRKYWAKK